MISLGFRKPGVPDFKRVCSTFQVRNRVATGEQERVWRKPTRFEVALAKANLCVLLHCSSPLEWITHCYNFFGQMRACVRACPGQTTRMECVLFPTRWKRGMPLQHYQKCVLPNGTAPLGSETIMQILNLIYIDWLIFCSSFLQCFTERGGGGDTYLCKPRLEHLFCCCKRTQQEREGEEFYSPQMR